jgi:adenine-specific DNA-methyltransferase
MLLNIGESLIKYLGSKRTLLPFLGAIASASGAKTAVDLFTGTTRVAQEFKRRGLEVSTVDVATYSDILSKTYIEADKEKIDFEALEKKLEYLQQRTPVEGYFTETFCIKARYFQPKNGMKVDAIRETLEAEFKNDEHLSILLTSLMLAADKVDSTTGVQMAYLKQWASRAHNDLTLKTPELIAGTGKSILGDAQEVLPNLPHVDLLYMDPPYNQHRYFTNYHIWESLIRWDKPESYGIAMKRIDSRDDETKSIFNKKREMPDAFRDVILKAKGSLVVVSYNNESWVAAEDIEQSLRDAGHEEVNLLEFDYKRYVGAQIGIYNPAGLKVGKVQNLRNKELVFVAGSSAQVAKTTEAVTNIRDAKQINDLFA